MTRMDRTVPGLVFAVVALTGAGIFGTARTTHPIRPNALDTTLLVRINGVRRAHSLRLLKRSPPLSVAAAEHTMEMGREGFFTHASLDQTVFWKRIERSYPSSGHRSWSVGENLLFVAPDVGAAEAVQLWMDSPKHRATLLDPVWREIGIAARHFSSAPGVYGDESVTIVTTDFGVRA
jgi:uncharacterized protein YkwD